MRSSDDIGHNQIYPPGVRTGATLLLVLYLLVFLLPSGSLPHVHHDHDLHASDTCHTDPCHISIYHPGSSGGCEHKFHFTTAPDDCDLCPSIVTRYLKAEQAQLYLCSPAPSIQQYTYINNPLVASVYFHHDRGPPMQSA